MCVQAREDVILLLRLGRAGPENLEAKYGSSVPPKVLQALQRDGGLLCNHGGGRRHRQQQQDVYEKPMAEVKLHPVAVERDKDCLLRRNLPVFICNWLLFGC